MAAIHFFQDNAMAEKDAHWELLLRLHRPAGDRVPERASLPSRQARSMEPWLLASKMLKQQIAPAASQGSPISSPVPSGSGNEPAVQTGERQGRSEASPPKNTARSRKVEGNKRQAWNLNRQGLSNSQIAMKMQLHESTISRYLKGPDPQ